MSVRAERIIGEGGKAVFGGADGEAAHGEDLREEVARVWLHLRR